MNFNIRKIINWIEWNTFLGCLEYVEYREEGFAFIGLGEDEYEVEILVDSTNRVFVDGLVTHFVIPFNIDPYWKNTIKVWF